MDGDQAISVFESLLPGAKDVRRTRYDSILIESALFISRCVTLRDDISEDQHGHVNRVAIEACRDRFGIDLSWKSLKSDPGGVLAAIRVQREAQLNKAGFLHAPEWVNHGLTKQSGDDVVQPTAEIQFALSISGMDLIDANKLTWDQVLEFRRDQESRAALRRLRLFFQDNLGGKDADYISDKLASLVEDHDRAARLWGFETAQRALSVAFTHKSLIASSAGGIASALAGAPLAVAAAAAIFVPLGSFGLEFSRAALDAAKSRTTEPTKFLTKLRKLGADGKS
jgi:hypothetical protein